MRVRKPTFTTRYVILVGILLLLSTSALSALVLGQLTDAMRTLINKDMLDVVNSAAASLDGDELQALTASDVDGPVFQDVKRRLLVFQNSTDIEFIYAVKQTEGGDYVFTVDPDPEEPAAFGEPIVETPALIAAAKGTPMVDEIMAADRWGSFYSAFSPVYNGAGGIAGVVGVDFDSQWYDEQVRRYTVSIAAFTATSVLLGCGVFMLVARRANAKIRELDEGLSVLSAGVDLLMEEVSSYSGMPKGEWRTAKQDADGDELEVLGEKIHDMQTELGLYVEHLQRQAYTDALTHVGNSLAYHEAIARCNQAIADGTADFCVVVFDVNGLKELNDTHGHECGDVYIQGAATAVARGLGEAYTYRIGGDEFAVVAEGMGATEAEAGLRAVDEAVATFNAQVRYPARLSLSTGVAHYEKGRDANYTEVFARADALMYEHKRAHYRALGKTDGRS